MNPSLLILLPVIVPLLTSALLMLFNHRRRLKYLMSALSMFLILAAGAGLLYHVDRNGILALQAGGWQAPFGITFVADYFSSIMVILAGLTGFVVSIYSIVDIDERRERHGYYSLLQILLMGVCGAFLTGDIFNLYVWFEVMLIASFALMAMGGRRLQMEGSLKYVILNFFASTFFLIGIGILYGHTGTLNMADLAVRLNTQMPRELVIVMAMVFLVSFGIKAGVFPFFFWLPASYHTPPVAVSAIFAGLLTKVGVYALIRVFTLIFIQDVAVTHRVIILVVSGITMLTGVLGALAQTNIRRLLSIHIISQIGYMTMGLGLFSPLGIAASIFHIFHNSIVKANLFLISGLVARHEGTFQLEEMGDLYRRTKFLPILFLIPALSLAGIPPLSGFFGKLGLVVSGLGAQTVLSKVVVGVSLIVSILTLMSMIKIWNEAFWKPKPAGVPVDRAAAPLREHALVFPVILLGMATVVIGFAAQHVFLFAWKAAVQLLNRKEYITAVLGDVL